jgi:hypothetical protein
VSGQLLPPALLLSRKEIPVDGSLGGSPIRELPEIWYI